MIRLYADENGGPRFAGKNPEAERLAARALRAEQRELQERLFAENMALLVEDVPTERPEFRNDPLKYRLGELLLAPVGKPPPARASATGRAAIRRGLVLVAEWLRSATIFE